MCLQLTNPIVLFLTFLVCYSSDGVAANANLNSLRGAAQGVDATVPRVSVAEVRGMLGVPVGAALCLLVAGAPPPPAAPLPRKTCAHCQIRRARWGVAI